ncbi:L-type lectin-domain containing protein [Evansella tamaricis]|uniref:L-type lectin-like domain-containing protein n=1 Tax=Evansella tamaricis TaxID=2069301 RepID=A0ABS6JE72_9BACI|nr:L-type lectin-domain containing protein [Evansella tamaricis]MBU9711976.1 hypothetical protein [Evansella tamaricis]
MTLLLIGCSNSEITLNEEPSGIGESVTGNFETAVTMDNGDVNTPISIWELEGDNKPKLSENGTITLTEAENWMWGRAWFHEEVALPFTINFQFQIGGGTGADGLTFMFLKDRYSTSERGEGLGFGSGNGYAIEFDTYENTHDTNNNHIALIKDHVENHLIQVDDPYLRDDRWHLVSVTVQEDSVDVVMNGERLFTYTGKLDTSYSSLGFSASTGASNDRHRVQVLNLDKLDANGNVIERLLNTSDNASNGGTSIERTNSSESNTDTIEVGNDSELSFVSQDFELTSGNELDYRVAIPYLSFSESKKGLFRKGVDDYYLLPFATVHIQSHEHDDTHKINFTPHKQFESYTEFLKCKEFYNTVEQFASSINGADVYWTYDFQIYTDKELEDVYKQMAQNDVSEQFSRAYDVEKMIAAETAGKADKYGNRFFVKNNVLSVGLYGTIIGAGVDMKRHLNVVWESRPKELVNIIAYLEVNSLINQARFGKSHYIKLLAPSADKPPIEHLPEYFLGTDFETGYLPFDFYSEYVWGEGLRPATEPERLRVALNTFFSDEKITSDNYGKDITLNRIVTKGDYGKAVAFLYSAPSHIYNNILSIEIPKTKANPLPFIVEGGSLFPTLDPRFLANTPTSGIPSKLHERIRINEKQ